MIWGMLAPVRRIGVSGAGAAGIAAMSATAAPTPGDAGLPAAGEAGAGAGEGVFENKPIVVLPAVCPNRTAPHPAASLRRPAGRRGAGAAVQLRRQRDQARADVA